MSLSHSSRKTVYAARRSSGPQCLAGMGSHAVTCARSAVHARTDLIMYEFSLPRTCTGSLQTFSPVTWGDQAGCPPPFSALPECTVKARHKYIALYTALTMSKSEWKMPTNIKSA